MSIENKLTYLNGTKDAIKQAIIGKGVSVTEADTFRSYATKIGEIQNGGSGGDCPKGVLDLSDGVGNEFNISNEFNELILPSNMDNVTSMYNCFSYCVFLKEITLPELPNVTRMDKCFNDCLNITSITLPSSLPKVTSMSSCFHNCSSLKEITLPDLPKVTNMSSCFSSCSSITSITLPDLSLVTTLKSFFDGCRKLTNITLPTNLNNVTDITYMFYSCTLLTSITLPDLPLIRETNQCFYNCPSLQNLSIGNINPNITALTNWYISYCTKLTVESLVNIMNALPTITNTRTCTIGTTNLRKLSPEQLAIGTNKGWTIN